MNLLYSSTLVSLLLLPTMTALADTRIVPGQRIGKIHVGMGDSAPEALLGAPDWSDGAAGTLYKSWGKGQYTLDVLCSIATEDSPRSVNVVRVDSPHFRTPDGLSTKSTLADIRRKHRRLSREARYIRKGRTGGTVTIFDDVKQGIAFEILNAENGDAGKALCIAIDVHRPGHRVRQPNEQEEWRYFQDGPF